MSPWTVEMRKLEGYGHAAFTTKAQAIPSCTMEMEAWSFSCKLPLGICFVWYYIFVDKSLIFNQIAENESFKNYVFKNLLCAFIKTSIFKSQTAILSNV